MQFAIRGPALALALALALAAILFHPALPAGGPAADGPEPTEASRAVVEGNNAFALELYAKLGKEEGNLVFSPFAVRTALAMAAAGADGGTGEEILFLGRLADPKPREPEAVR